MEDVSACIFTAYTRVSCQSVLSAPEHSRLVVVSHRRRKDRSVLWHHYIYHGIQATEGQRYQDHRGGVGQVRRVSYNEIHVPTAHTTAVSARRNTVLCLRVHKTEESPEHQKVWQPAVSCRIMGRQENDSELFCRGKKDNSRDTACREYKPHPTAQLSMVRTRA